MCFPKTIRVTGAPVFRMSFDILAFVWRMEMCVNVYSYKLHRKEYREILGHLCYRSMLNCVNALEQHLPSTEESGLVAEEKTQQDSCKDQIITDRCRNVLVLDVMWMFKAECGKKYWKWCTPDFRMIQHTKNTSPR